MSHFLYNKDNNTEELIFKWHKWFASYCIPRFRLCDLFKCNVIRNQHYIQNYFVVPLVQYYDAILACYWTKKHKQTNIQNMINQWAKPIKIICSICIAKEIQSDSSNRGKCMENLKVSFEILKDFIKIRLDYILIRIFVLQC